MESSLLGAELSTQLLNLGKKSFKTIEKITRAEGKSAILSGGGGMRMQ